MAGHSLQHDQLKQGSGCFESQETLYEPLLILLKQPGVFFSAEWDYKMLILMNHKCMQIITPDKLPMEVLELLPKGVSEWARLALFLLAEQHIGQAKLYHSSTSHIAVLHCLSINLMT
jgi:hypothetical protein